MVSGAEGHFRRDAQDAAFGKLLLQGFQLFGIRLFRDEQGIPDFQGRARLPVLRCYPVLCLDFPDGPSEMFFQYKGILFRIAVNDNSDGFAPLDLRNDGIRISGNAFAPGVFPFGGGQFVPAPAHGVSMKTFFFGGKNGCGKGSCLELF